MGLTSVTWVNRNRKTRVEVHQVLACYYHNFMWRFHVLQVDEIENKQEDHHVCKA